VTPADIARLGLGNQLLADLDKLRPHLLRVGAIVPAASADADEGGKISDADDVAAARPAPGLTLEEYLAACDPVLGQRAIEFALVLPALPGVGATLDDAIGTLDTDQDVEEVGRGADADADADPTLAEQLRRCTPSERDRYRSFVERLVDRASGYPMVVRDLAARCVLHAIAVDLWPHERWPEVLKDALVALGADGDEPGDDDLAAASALAAVSLGLLRTDVGRMSRQDEHTMRYEAAGAAVRHLLARARDDRIELLAAELPEPLTGAAGIVAAQTAIEEILNPLSGAARSARLLAEEYDIHAEVTHGSIVDLLEPLEGVPEARLLLAITLAADAGPVYVRATMQSGRAIVGAWRAPWLAIERAAPTGSHGRAWKLTAGQTPGMLAWDDLPKSTCTWFGGQPRPEPVKALLESVEA
jgi:hypothetical protein